MARANYRRELRASALLPLAQAAVEGSVIGVIVKTGYEGVVEARTLNFATAILTGAGEWAYLSSFVWAAAAHGRPKVPLLSRIQLAMVLMVAAIALAPRSAPGLWALGAAVLGARVCIAGVQTLRTTIWRANYPRSERARVQSKFATVQTVVMAGASIAVGAGSDVSDGAFRLMVLAACVLALGGVWSYGRIRVRGHRRLVRTETAGHRDHRPTLNPWSMVRLLAMDRDYAAYMACMFLLGIGNLALTAPLIIMLRDRFGFDALEGVVLTFALPCALMPFFLPLWSRLLARVHVARFRAFHAWTFVLAQALVLLASLTGSIGPAWAAAAVLGIAWGGGSLAWNLGHLDFAPAHRAAQYMGVHVTLTGVRGVIAPVLIVAAYEWLRGLGGGERGAEQWVFGLSLIPCVLGAAGFGLLALAMGERARGAPRES